MSAATAVVRGWRVVEVRGDPGVFNAASLVKQVIGHLALALLPELDAPIWREITPRHVLSHSTGLPNWRAPGCELEPLRAPGERWGYSGEGFVLLQAAVERQAGLPITRLAKDLVFEPLGMNDSHLDEPEEGFHGYRPLQCTAQDYGRFLAHVLGLDDERWVALVPDRREPRLGRWLGPGAWSTAVRVAVGTEPGRLQLCHR